VLLAALFTLFAVFLHATHWGRAVYAIGNNREAARYSGVNVKRVHARRVRHSGAMSALAAIVLTAYLASARSDTAVGLELPVITAVVSAASTFLAARAAFPACCSVCWCSPSCKTPSASPA